MSVAGTNADSRAAIRSMGNIKRKKNIDKITKPFAARLYSNTKYHYVYLTRIIVLLKRLYLLQRHGQQRKLLIRTVVLLDPTEQ